MYNGHKISVLMDECRQKKKDVLFSLEMEYKTLKSIIEGNPTAKSLEKIADYFKVPIDYFFDREVELPKHGVSISGDGNKVQHGNGNVMIEQAKEIDHLKQLLEEKERTIQILLKQK